MIDLKIMYLLEIIDGPISSQDIVLLSIIFMQFLLIYFPGYNVIKSKSGNIEMVFWGISSSLINSQTIHPWSGIHPQPQ